MAWTLQLRALFRGKSFAQELDEELEFHLAMCQQWNEDRGVAAATARRQARLRFGNPLLWRERISEIDLAMLPQTVLQDLRYGAGILMRNAGFTPVAVLALAMAGIATLVGLMGLLLASMGVYGTVSYMVVLRTREVGIRLALGAKKRDVLRLMLEKSARPVLAGLGAGVLLAVVASYLLRGVLYGVSRVDGVSFGGASLVVVAIAMLATYLPSRRALRVEPMAALRSE